MLIELFIWFQLPNQIGALTLQLEYGQAATSFDLNLIKSARPMGLARFTAGFGQIFWLSVGPDPIF